MHITMLMFLPVFVVPAKAGIQSFMAVCKRRNNVYGAHCQYGSYSKMQGNAAILVVLKEPDVQQHNNRNQQAAPDLELHVPGK